MHPTDGREGTIETLLQEERRYPPSPEFVAQVNISDPQVYERAEKDPEGFWRYLKAQLLPLGIDYDFEIGDQAKYTQARQTLEWTMVTMPAVPPNSSSTIARWKVTSPFTTRRSNAPY